MHEEKTNSRGYVLVHCDWYENPNEPDMLHRNAVVLTLNPQAFELHGNAQLVKRGYALLEPPDEMPFAYTICDCRPVAGGNNFTTLEEAQERLHELGALRADLGFNPRK